MNLLKWVGIIFEYKFNEKQQIMNTYTKSDQYYEDEYDRLTISHLQDLEEQIKEQAKKSDYIGLLRFKYKTFGAERASQRDESIRSWKEADQRRDKLIATTPIPKYIKCNTCQSEMQFELHDFNSEGRLIFYFKCHDGHLPKKAIYADGSEYYIKTRVCSYCNGPLETKKKRTKAKLKLTDTCRFCGKTEVLEYDFAIEKRPEITEEDRLKYCKSFIGKRTFQEDMEALEKLTDLLKSKEKKYDYSHVEQINIVQLEKKLSDELEKAQFVKFQFEKPKSGRWLTVEFSVQDFSSRDERSSIKALKKALTTSLFNTNWRLMSTDIIYTLGFLTGQIKGFSLEEDLIKIGKEIDIKRTNHK
nr:hypothetical protein [uncultured Fluviicola sp.]